MKFVRARDSACSAAFSKKISPVVRTTGDLFFWRRAHICKIKLTAIAEQKKCPLEESFRTVQARARSCFCVGHSFCLRSTCLKDFGNMNSVERKLSITHERAFVNTFFATSRKWKYEFLRTRSPPTGGAGGWSYCLPLFVKMCGAERRTERRFLNEKRYHH